MPSEPPADATPVDLLNQAQAGDGQARDRLLGWAYVTAHSYYRKKSDVESALTLADAEDLASAFYLEFTKAWPRIRVVYNYTRRMLKNNLRRHLIRARTRHGREVLLSHSELLYRFEAQLAAAPATGSEWNDRDWLRHRVIGRVIKAADEQTRELVRFRCADPAMTYGEIAQRVGTSEAALRMRMARFYETVRKVHALASHHTSEHGYS